jgi:crotonobetainyl-CoA:carnitine CoA-transferase CaiB-like acyl-CoA transferase
MHEIYEDEQAKAAGVFVPFADSELMTVTSPFWVDGFDKPDPKPAPRVGEHTNEIMSKLGYPAETQEELRKARIIS